MKHTKGPWKVVYGSDYDSSIETEKGFLVVSGVLVNDAALIAAAPELLETLQHSVKELMRAYKMTKELETQDHEFGAALNELVMRLNEDCKNAVKKAGGK